jgi:thioredoxin 1
MNRIGRLSLAGLLLAAVCVSGCKEGGAVAFRADSADDLSTLLADSAAMSQSKPSEGASGPIATTLVSSSTYTQSPQPTLITLPRGGDLNAQIENAEGSVLLDFFAVWCGPCRMQGQILHDVEDTAAKTQTQIIKINVDEHPDLAQQLQVQSLPTLMMVKNGRIVERQSGVANANQLAAWMQ